MNDVMRQAAGERDYYRLFFQEPGRPRTDLEATWTISYVPFCTRSVATSWPTGCTRHWDVISRRGRVLSRVSSGPDILPPWLTEDDLAFYVSEFFAHRVPGRPPLVPRHRDATDDLRPVRGRGSRPTSAVSAGECDLIAGDAPEALADLPTQVPGLRNMKVLPVPDTGCNRNAPPRSTNGWRPS